MISFKQHYLQENSLLQESGLQNIRALAKKYAQQNEDNIPKAEIYFHQDEDGLLSAIAMREYLKQYGFKVVKYNWTQYGDREFSVDKFTNLSSVMPVLVDFAHGKPQFKIWTDHHDSQMGDAKNISTSFRSSPSNAETISGIISPNIFDKKDIEAIRAIDSAGYSEIGLEPKDLHHYSFKGKETNYYKFAAVVRRLVLAYKGIPGFMEKIAANAGPSWSSIYSTIRNTIKDNRGETRKVWNPETKRRDKELPVYADPDQLQSNLDTYVKERQADFKHPNKDAAYLKNIKLVYQYGMSRDARSRRLSIDAETSSSKEAGFAQGAYDRYVIHRLFPDHELTLSMWGPDREIKKVSDQRIGLVQLSKNKWNKNMSPDIKSLDLGDIVSEVMEVYKPVWEKIRISLKDVKEISEISSSENSINFTNADLYSLFNTDKMQRSKVNGQIVGSLKSDEFRQEVKTILNKKFNELNDKEKITLSSVKIPLWDIYKANSGGHPGIQNISGTNYIRYDRFGNDVPYKSHEHLLRKIGLDIINKIKDLKGEEDVNYKPIGNYSNNMKYMKPYERDLIGSEPDYSLSSKYDKRGNENF